MGNTLRLDDIKSFNDGFKYAQNIEIFREKYLKDMELYSYK